MFEPRTYRKKLNRERFQLFDVQHLESDILIGVDKEAYCTGMKEASLETTKVLRRILDGYGSANPQFFASHKPLPPDHEAPSVIARMIESGIRSGTGPMTSVAGMFAFETGKHLMESYDISELLVENGGDIFLINKEMIYVRLFAGKSPLSNRFAFEIPPGEWGISTSSGTVGHSHSYGKADAVSVICKDPVISDAWATSLANKIKAEDDIEKVMQYTETIPEILGCMIICNEKVGVRGEFKIKPADSI